MSRIFDLFEQDYRTFQTHFDGIGLGLAISKSLSEAHGGSLIAKSAGRDGGSTFALTINTISPAPRVPAQRDKKEAEPRPLRILLVDDHQDTCTALERLLVRRGHLVA